MILGDFIHKKRRLLDSFNLTYMDKHKKEPEKYPLHLEYSEWVKQFIIFCENTNERTN